MTYDEFMNKVLDAFPDALVAMDGSGEIQILTGLTFAEDGSGDVEPLPDHKL